MEPLVGQELINRIKELGHLTPREQAAACGYVTPKGRVNLHAFYQAALAAKGLGAQAKRMGRTPGFTTKVQTTGSLVLGRTYITQVGAEPGTQFGIEVKRNRIVLTPLAQAS